jgi:hypothetical protein
MSGSSTHPNRFDWVERARGYLKPLAAGGGPRQLASTARGAS